MFKHNKNDCFENFLINESNYDKTSLFRVIFTLQYIN